MIQIVCCQTIMFSKYYVENHRLFHILILYFYWVVMKCLLYWRICVECMYHKEGTKYIYIGTYFSCEGALNVSKRNEKYQFTLHHKFFLVWHTHPLNSWVTVMLFLISSHLLYTTHHFDFLSVTVCSRENVAVSASLCVHLHRVRVKVNIKVKVKLFLSMLCRHIQEVEV